MPETTISTASWYHHMPKPSPLWPGRALSQIAGAHGAGSPPPGDRRTAGLAGAPGTLVRAQSRTRNQCVSTHTLCVNREDACG